MIRLKRRSSDHNRNRVIDSLFVVRMSVTDPLLKDLSEKKKSFRQSVVLLAAELKDARRRLSLQEEVSNREFITRQVAEAREKNMKEENLCLKKCLEDKQGELQASVSTAEQYLKDLDDLRSQLATTQAIADASAASAQSAQFQCLEILEELDEKNLLLKEHEHLVNGLAEQLVHLQKDLEQKEASQKQIMDVVLRIQGGIVQSVAETGPRKDCELRTFLDEVSLTNSERISKDFTVKDKVIAKLTDQIRIMSAHWKQETKKLEAKLEKHQRADEELKKRVLRLEFCLQEANSQTRKLQRIREKNDKALKELRDQLKAKQQGEYVGVDKQNFWESSGFKIVVSMTMLILIVFGRR